MTTTNHFEKTYEHVRRVEHEFLQQQNCADLPWRIILTENDIDLLVTRVAKIINERFARSKKPLVLVGILKGVYVFLADLSKKLNIPYSVYFLEASSYKGQTQSKVQFASSIETSKIKGRHVLLLDELFDNGNTMAAMRQVLLDHAELELEPADITTCALFSKNSGTTLSQPDIVGIAKLPNVWFVGYGLDDNGEKRGWPHLFAVPKANVPATADDVLFDDEDTYRKICATIVGTLTM